MSWSWSHTQEAYAAAEKNLRKLSQEKIAEIWAEWRATTNGDFDMVKYESELKRAKEFIATGLKGTLCDEIWFQAAEQATCDNGGFNCWLCPSGCGCHTVAFD